MRVEIDLTDEQRDEMLLEELYSSWEMMNDDIARLEEKKKLNGLKEFEEEDLKHARKICKHIKKVIKFYCIPSKFKEYFPD